MESEEDFLAKANSDISQLCAENILLWNKFLDAFTLRDVVRNHLATINHRHRLKRFSEGFFTMTNPRKAALCCLDVKHSHHTSVSEAVRKSPYFVGLPALQVSCKELDGTPDTLPIIFEDVYSDSLVPRTCPPSACLPPACLLVAGGREGRGPPTPRPASVPLDRLSGLSSSSLDLLHSELAVLEVKTEPRKNDPKKKISLPAPRRDGPIKVERKRSVDSSLGSSLSPTLSPDMKGYLKEKLKSMKPRRRGSKQETRSQGGGRKGVEGYSHLDCCADVPYNLAEEPEQVDGVEESEGEGGAVLDCSFTSRTLQEEQAARTPLETMRCAVKEEEEARSKSAVKNEEGAKRVSRSEAEERLEGMASLRQIVLAESLKQEISDCSLSDSSSQEASNSSSSVSSTPPRQHSEASILTDLPSLPADPVASSNSQHSQITLLKSPFPLGSLSSPLLDSSETCTQDPVLKSSASEVTFQPSFKRAPVSSLAGLRSPLLLLGQAGRSRSEEPQAVTEPLPRRPRHQSECHPPPSVSSLPRKRNTTSPDLPTPPEGFRDPPSRNEGSVARLRQQQFSEARSNSVLSAPSLREEAEEVVVRGSEPTDRKMSRSNTISFGEGEVMESSDHNVAEKLAELRLRRSGVTSTPSPLVLEEQEVSPVLMEHKSLPARTMPPALVPGGTKCLS